MEQTEKTILIRLSGIQGWYINQGKDYPTTRMPTPSGIVGILANCLGYSRVDPKCEELLEKSINWDFHIWENPLVFNGNTPIPRQPTVSQEIQTCPKISEEEKPDEEWFGFRQNPEQNLPEYKSGTIYWEKDKIPGNTGNTNSKGALVKNALKKVGLLYDHEFIVAIRLPLEDAGRLSEALEDPQGSPFLGKMSFVPSMPLNLGQADWDPAGNDSQIPENITQGEHTITLKKCNRYWIPKTRDEGKILRNPQSFGYTILQSTPGRVSSFVPTRRERISHTLLLRK